MTPPPPSNHAETILVAALDHAPEDREAFLTTACGDDAALLTEVRALLAAHEVMPSRFLAEPAMQGFGGGDLDVTLPHTPGPKPQRSVKHPPVFDDRLSAEMKTLAMPSGSQTSAGSSSADPAPPVPFIFGKRIAQGGMGAILETEDCKLGRTIAAKVMLLEQDATEDMRQRFIQEAAVLAKLAHPNIVPVYDLGHDESGQLYYTMKLVKGRTLQDILDDLRLEHPLALRDFTLERLLTIFRKVADALAFAHSKGIIHRDLKPENVMVGEFGEVLLMDWGLAKILDKETERLGDKETSDPTLTQSLPLPVSSSSSASLTHTLHGTVMGTPKYMSPEQAMGLIDELDTRSDIFSLGGILYAILTLRPPVEGKTVEEVLAKVSSASITPPTAFGATASSGAKQAKGAVLEAKQIKPLPHIPAGRVPAALSSVAMKALRLDKARRYQDVAAFSADIEAYQNGFATTAEEAGLGKQLVLLIKRHKGIFSTAAAAWLLITALAVWFVINLRAKEQRATQAEGEARQALAKSQLDLAEKEFERGKFVEAQKIIEETPESFRDANWRFLHAHAHDFTAPLLLRGIGDAEGLQFLPQGDRFAASCWLVVKGGVGIFSLTGQPIGDFLPFTEQAARSFWMDREGRRVAQAATANEVAVWDLATRKVLRRWTCEIGLITHVLLSPDGGTVLAAGGQQLIAYAAETGAPLWTRPFFGAAPAFSPDGQTVAILAAKNGLDLQVQLLDPATGAVLATLQASADHPSKTALQFNQAGDQLACLGGDEVILWNPRTTQKIRALHFPGETVKRLNPRGDSVATSSGNRIRLWETKTGRLLRSLNGAVTPVHDLAFSPDGRMLISTHRSAENVVTYVWPTRLGEETATMAPASVRGRRVLFDADGSRVYATAAGNGGAWEPLTGQQKWKALRKGRADILDLAIHPVDGDILFCEHVFSEHSDRISFTRMSPAGELLEDFGVDKGTSLKFNRSGQLLLTVDYAHNPTDPGHGFKVLEYPSGKELRNVTFEKRGQPFAAFCLDDAVVATAALTGGITLWDWQAGKPLRQIAAAQTGSIACLAASPDGQHLATGGPDRWIRVWEAKTGRLEVAFRAHWEGVSCMKFSPDGSELLSGSDDGTVRIHDAASGEERLAFYGLTTPVADVDLSADGKLIAAISRVDGVAKVWDRQRSSAAALLPEGVTAIEPVVAQDASKSNTPSTPVKNPPPPPAIPKAPASPLATKDAPNPATAPADALIAAGWTAEAIPLLEKASISKPGDAMLALRLAALQAWFGMDAEWAATRQRMLDWVPKTTDAAAHMHIATLACLRPLADESQRQAALATARSAVEKGNNPVTEPMRRLALGMAEYRSGHYLAADAALTAAVEAAPASPVKVMIEGTANYYRVMSLFHQGKTDEARALFAETEAKVPRLPADEKNPLTTVSGQDSLILWLACKEAKALLAAPAKTPK